jgi:hypothetical protein
MSDRAFLVPVPHGPPRVYGSLEEWAGHAAGHAHARLLVACEAIAMIGGLAAHWQKPHAPRLSLQRARIQDGTAGPGEQAAHMLPGQLLIDGRPPWAMARGDRRIAAWLARFEVTAAVPTPFNTADSAAERAGLKDAFLRACEGAWSRVVAGERDLTPTYGGFLADADRAFDRAQLRKDGRRAAAARRGEAHASDERFVEGVILRLYKAHGVTAEEATRRFPLAAFTS